MAYTKAYTHQTTTEEYPMRRTLARMTAAAAAVLAFAAPATADDEHPWDAQTPTIYAAVHDATPAQLGDIVIQVNAPRLSWGIKQSARRLGAQVDGVSVRTAGDCSTADMCVTVKVGRYDEAAMLQLSNGYLSAWGAITTWPTAQTSTIYLNRDVAQGRSYRRYAAAHEFGHVLGLGHHAQPGLMSEPTPGLLLSNDEVAVLEGWYLPLAAAR